MHNNSVEELIGKIASPRFILLLDCVLMFDITDGLLWFTVLMT